MDQETKLWKALSARLGPGQVGWGEILTFRNSQGVFGVEIAMFWLGCSSHQGVLGGERELGDSSESPLPRRIYLKPGADP